MFSLKNIEFRFPPPVPIVPKYPLAAARQAGHPPSQQTSWLPAGQVARWAASLSCGWLGTLAGWPAAHPLPEVGKVSKQLEGQEEQVQPTQLSSGGMAPSASSSSDHGMAQERPAKRPCNDLVAMMARLEQLVQWRANNLRTAEQFENAKRALGL